MARPKKIVEEKKVVRRGRPKKVKEDIKKLTKKPNKNEVIEDMFKRITELEVKTDKLEKKVNDFDADLNDLFKDVEDATKSNSRSKEDDIKELLDLFAKSKKVTKPEPVGYVYVSTRRYF